MKSDPQNGQPDITLGDVIAHQQYHFQEMRKGFANVDDRLHVLEKDMKEVKSDLTIVKANVDRLERRIIQIDTKIGNLDERLDDIEVIPNIVKHLRSS